VGRLAVIGGTSVRESEFGSGADPVTIDGVTLLETGAFLILQRHGLDRFVRADLVDHRANIAALRTAGVDRVLGLASSGSLRLDWPIGTVACPDDFYAPHVTDSFDEGAGSHAVPGFDRAWRTRVLETWRARAATPIVDGGVYTQTRGPRFETPAEVRALARVGDLVGMTLAAECILAKEAGIAYAAVCVVDNFANGLEPEPLTMDEFWANVTRNRVALLADLDAVLPALAGAG
jgi:5'-methylthioadenosine phosphorylase